MPSSILYDEIEELKALKDEIKEIFNKEEWYFYENIYFLDKNR
jgi:hypothetical protein